MITSLGLQRVVGRGSAAGAALCAQVQPVDPAVAVVAAAMALEGAQPGHRARFLHVVHVVDGDAAVEAGANCFEYQLEGVKRREGVTVRGREDGHKWQRK